LYTYCRDHKKVFNFQFCTLYVAGIVVT